MQASLSDPAANNTPAAPLPSGIPDNDHDRPDDPSRRRRLASYPGNALLALEYASDDELHVTASQHRSHTPCRARR
jgi:hypothetical protein